MKRAITRNLRQLVATIALALVALAVGFGILLQQAADFPAWVPILGGDRFELRGEFATAQAVIPGQGQTVNIAGIKVGLVVGVELIDGRAVVRMELENEYAPLLHDDTSMLLRPRTGLQDMTVELDPGADRGELEEGSTVQLASTATNVNTDQVLASLDGDTQAYLKLLISGGGEGLGDRGEIASAGLRRFEPTARDIAKINGALAVRRRNIARVIHNLRLLSEELDHSDRDLGTFISASDVSLSAFAEQEGAIRASLRELPATLVTTRGALGASQRLSRLLGPTLRELTPGAEALAPALRSTSDLFEQTLRPIRDQIRPFSRRVGPTVSILASAAPTLARSAVGLQRSLHQLNGVFNTLAYNPPGDDEGYLFWLAWLNHNLNNTFQYQDGQATEQRSILMLSCQTRLFADAQANIRPAFKTVLDLTRLPTQADIC